jgi:cytochrome c peroxidase
MLISALFAFCGPIGQMLIAGTRKWIYRAIAHVRIRRVGVCVAVDGWMSTAIPILFARDSSEPFSPATLAEIARVEADIDRIEADTLKRLNSVPDNQVQQIELLGKLMLFDKELSVNRNEACAFCHMPETGFTGPISELNRTTGSYPGSVRTRFSERKPQTHTHAPLAPVLHYNQTSWQSCG